MSDTLLRIIAFAFLSVIMTSPSSAQSSAIQLDVSGTGDFEYGVNITRVADATTLEVRKGVFNDGGGPTLNPISNLIPVPDTFFSGSGNYTVTFGITRDNRGGQPNSFKLAVRLLSGADVVASSALVSPSTRLDLGPFDWPAKKSAEPPAFLLQTGLGFTGVLVIFLIIAFFRGGNLAHAQLQILRFLMSLCAGFSGGLLTGDALFRLSTSFGHAGNLVVSGAAGCALFFTVWFTFKVALIPKDGICFSIPEGWTFKAAVGALAKGEKVFVEFVGFEPHELSAPLEPHEVRAWTIEEALKDLRMLANDPIIKPYVVQRDGQTIGLRRKP